MTTSSRMAGVARGSLAYNFSGLRIQRRVEREGSVTVVFKAMLFGAARRER